MSISYTKGTFVAEVSQGLLSARRFIAVEGWGKGGESYTGCASEALFTFPVAYLPWFAVQNDGLYAQNGAAPLYQGEDAPHLLECITNVLRKSASQKRIRRLGLICAGVLLIIGSAGVCGYQLAISSVAAIKHTTSDYSERSFSLNKQQVVHRAPAHEAAAEILPAAPVKAAPEPADGWSLPAAVRTVLPGNLRAAASRSIFTVPLSEGHARTLYVFADPSCANCRRMERHFETAAEKVNIVIFPVTIEGKSQSLQALTPVMMMPEAERAAAWKQLFSADAGVSVPGSQQPELPAADAEKAELARGAIGVNEVAFRRYMLPGTPWTISDDGRYVSQAVLSSPAALEVFLSEGNADGQ